MAKEIKNRWLILLSISSVGFFIDWFTKSLAVKHLTPGHPVPVLGDTLQWLLLFNKNALFGLDPRRLVPGLNVDLIFSIFTIIAIVALIVYYAYLRKDEIIMHIGLAMVMPGAIGNLFDRIIAPGRGVVDFIMVDLNFPPFNPWPIFNMADAYVTVGVVLLLIAMVLDDRRKKSAGQ